MTSPKSVLIIAPHIDDEMIGCWSVIQDQMAHVTVLFLFELTPERRLEALGAAALYGYTVVFGSADWGDNTYANFHEVYVPSRRDWHADHQTVNRKYRQYATHFYSVDMAHGVLLASSDEKALAMNLCYPSQQNLWRHNDKYWLFEDIQKTDYDNYSVITQGGFGGLSVTVLQQYERWVRSEWLPAITWDTDNFISPESISHLLAHCTGKVTIRTHNKLIEA